MNQFKEWLSDYLRYILLFFAAIILVVVGFFAVRLITSLGKVKEPETEIVAVEEEKDEPETAAAANTNLKKDQADVLDVITRYYTARASKDYTTLSAICEVFNDEIQAEIEHQDADIESYTNIMTYSMDGVEDGSYLVYVYFDAKISGVPTAAPSLRELYLISGKDGNLVISDKESSAQQEAYAEQVRSQADVQALIKDVNKKLSDAMDADAALKSYVETGTVASSESGDSSSSSGDTASEENAGTSQTTNGSVGKMYATTGVNVRSTSSTDGAIYGTLYEGMEVEVLEQLDNGWSHITYTTDGTTIDGYVSSDYLTK